MQHVKGCFSMHQKGSLSRVHSHAACHGISFSLHASERSLSRVHSHATCHGISFSLHASERFSVKGYLHATCQAMFFHASERFSVKGSFTCSMSWYCTSEKTYVFMYCLLLLLFSLYYITQRTREWIRLLAALLDQSMTYKSAYKYARDVNIWSAVCVKTEFIQNWIFWCIFRCIWFD